MFLANKLNKGGSLGGYQISRSLRFNRSDSTYLNRTPSSTGSRTTFTLSFWTKLGNLTTGADSFMWSTGDATVGNPLALLWKTFNGSYYFNLTGGTTELATTSVYRDPSAWYHIVVAVDTTQATSTNRIKMYVNGVQVTSFITATYPAQNFTYDINTSSYPAYLGCLFAGGFIRFWEGYMTEVNFIDGQGLTPSSFGETNAQTGVWQPKAYSGSYGTNGFYLNFSDNSNTTAATLGKDYSGNGNNWTPNNFSVTAGAGNDSLVDSPTSYGTDTGVGGEVRGNYSTMNPINVLNATSANGNLDWTITAGETNNGVGTIAVSSGKWYWEVLLTSASAMIGVCDATSSATNRSWQSANGWAYLGNGLKYTNNASASYGASYTTNDVIGVALDMDAGTVTFYKNGASQGVAYSVFSGKTITPYLGSPSGSGGPSATATYNFGQRPFAYTAPSGYKALCTQNLPTPTIGATSATLAGKFFNPVTFTSPNGGAVVTGVGFQPDFSWTKGRSAAESHILSDVIRGNNAYLATNNTNAEATFTNMWVPSSDGYSIAVGALSSSQTYVGWNWKANGTGVTNTAGSITSTVSANTTSGFSVVTYTGTGANATVGHGLGVAPKMVITKARSSAISWLVYNANFTTPVSDYFFLDTTAAVTTTSGYWNTAPTSTTFGVGPYGGNNGSAITYVAYCFAEVAGYSAFGKYTGNGSTDGPFVFTGMRPSYVMVKIISSTGDWIVEDGTRNPYNVVNAKLSPNTSGVEFVDASAIGIDFLSNGFKLRGTDGAVNNTSQTYIYMAFASNPFKYSLAR